MNLEPERRQSSSASEPPLRLLVVDDDPNYLAYVSLLTRRLGFWVDTAEDGEIALRRLAISHYDAAIIDYEMPRLSGVQMVARIRADETLKSIYTVMLTAREDLDTKVVALEAGFDDFMTKTASEREIVAKLVATRRIAMRQRTMDVTIRDLYGLATRDDLTGTFNRRFFISEGDRLLAEGIAVNLILLDLDGFKEVNDRYGHLAGDEVLRDVATLLQTSTRPEDIVTRFGGDEFVVVVPHLPAEAVERVAGRLARGVEALRWEALESLRIGVSSGVASSHLLDEPTLAQLLNAADRDMYKNKWVRNNPELNPELYEYPAGERDERLRLSDVKERATR